MRSPSPFSTIQAAPPPSAAPAPTPARDQIMQSALDRLTAELKTCRVLLQSYGDQHSAKFPPQHQKALTNYRQVDSINRTFVHVGELLNEIENLDQRQAASAVVAGASACI